MVFRTRVALGVVSLLFACTKQDQIELYLTKEPIESYEGIALNQSQLDSATQSEIQQLYGEQLRVDTLQNRLLYSGRFKLSQQELQEKPFIIDAEILHLDFENSQLVLQPSVVDKLAKAMPSWQNYGVRGRQFALCYNGENILTGYLFPSTSSYWSNTYQIHTFSSREPEQTSVRFFFNDSINFTANHLRKNKALEAAFARRNQTLE